MSWAGTSGHDHSSMGQERRSDILKLILYDLNSAIAPQDHRIMALQTAISEFDHDQDYKHDEELDLHADKILFQKLAFAFHVDRSSEEVAMICTALEMVYRASRSRVAMSFAELRESVLPMFVEMLGKPLHLRKQEELDISLAEQEERVNAQEISYRSARSGSFAGTASHSGQSGPTFKSQSTDDMSLQSAGKDDPTYQSYQPSVQKPHKPEPDEQSYLTFDEQSLQKPSKQLADDQSYQTYDQSQGGGDLVKPDPNAHPDDQTFQSYDQPGHPDDQTFQSYGQGQHPDDQASQSYDQSRQSGSNRDDGTFQTYDDRTQQTYDHSLAKGASEYDEQSYQSYGPSIQKGSHQPNAIDEEKSYSQSYQGGEGEGKSYAESQGTFQDGQSQGQGTYDDDGTYQEGQSQAQETYDQGTYRDGEETYDDGTYQNEVRGNDGDDLTMEERTLNDDTTYEGQTTIHSDEKSMGQDTQITEEGYHSEEQSLQPTTYTQDEKTYTQDEKTFGDEEQTQYTASGQSLQPTTYEQRAYDKNQALDDQSYQPSYAEEEATQYTQDQDQSYRGDEASYQPSYAQDDMSEYTEDLRKPTKETYDVETVYTEDGDDEQSRDPSLNSNQSSFKGDYPVKGGTSVRSTGLSTVAEASHESDSEFSSQHSGFDKSRSLHSQPSLPTVTEDVSMRSERSTGVSSVAARAIKERKMEKDRHMNEQVARLEAELEMIRVEDATNPVGVSRTLQVLRYFSRVLSAMVPMAHHPGLLDALVYQLERQPYGKHSDHFNEYDDGEPRTEEDKEELAAARVDAIATIVNLACAEENKAKMAAYSGLLDAITMVAQNDPSEEAREHAAIVLMNLAYEDENKEMMVQHPQMLETLVKLVQDNSPFTRRYASAAMFTLACVVGNTERMAVYCDGEILECLRRVLADDPVDEARINASEALFNMARNNTEETLQTMGDHPRLLATLAKAVLTDYSADVRVFCARALEWMSAGIHFPMDCHRLLLSALTVSAQWTKTSCIAEAMKTQATLAENRLPMASHDGLLQALSNLALLESLTDTDVRKSAIAALEMISRADRARPCMVRNEQVMRALT
eukprot:CAMPEP_0119032198 /NCGR_PEP_ID=MMETSP1176-20130426/41932_1 /TAXON_ID=265551 /ORGANISM="Synedropsis recta cf, Strain CCMP1620" /LENGTH=1081 /DNA_ID=CAMNT_0006988609 /DNA_START=42 /DNA_END=3284 /DNA_ORIENTATION=-